MRSLSEEVREWIAQQKNEQNPEPVLHKRYDLNGQEIYGKALYLISNQENVNENHTEKSLYIHKAGKNQKVS